MAVRLAIGASRGRIVRQILTECLVLAAAGGALGALVGAAGVDAGEADWPRLKRPESSGSMFGSTILPRGHEVGVDLKVLAHRVRHRRDHERRVRRAARPAPVAHEIIFTPWDRAAAAPAAENRRIRAALVVGQLVLATVLLVGAGLLIHSFVKLSTFDKGYDPSNVLAFNLLFPTGVLRSPERPTPSRRCWRGSGRPRTCESAGFARAGLLIGEELTIGTFVPPGRTLDEMRDEPRARCSIGERWVSHGDGRPACSTGASSRRRTPRPRRRSIVINRSVARRYFGDGQPGRTVRRLARRQGSAFQMRVVGVVEDVRQESPDREAIPEVFVDYRQFLALSAAVGRLGAATGTRGRSAFCRSRFAPAATPRPPCRSCAKIVQRGRSQHRHRRDPSDGSPGGQLRRPPTLLRGAARRVRRRRGCACGDWHLRRARLCRDSAHAGDRHPHGARGAACAGAGARASQGCDPHDHRRRAWARRRRRRRRGCSRACCSASRRSTRRRLSRCR